jgi:hypothetical protein
LEGKSTDLSRINCKARLCGYFIILQLALELSLTAFSSPKSIKKRKFEQNIPKLTKVMPEDNRQQSMLMVVSDNRCCDCPAGMLAGIIIPNMESP